jgi:hypothetical protein
MKVWVLHGSYENELFSTVHFTQKGCALMAIAEVLDFLQVNSTKDAVKFANDCNPYRETDGEQTEAPEWDLDKMGALESEQLWIIFNEWQELGYHRMSDRNFFLDYNVTQVQG